MPRTSKKPRRDVRYAAIRIEFGKRLKNERTQRKLTQQQVANELDVSQPRVSEWERGVSFPSIPQTLVFCERRGIGLERLFSGIAPFEHGEVPLGLLEVDDRTAVEHLVTRLAETAASLRTSTAQKPSSSPPPSAQSTALT